MISFTIGAYLGIVYTHAYITYNDKLWEPMQALDILFLVFAPVSYPLMLIYLIFTER